MAVGLREGQNPARKWGLFSLLPLLNLVADDEERRSEQAERDETRVEDDEQSNDPYRQSCHNSLIGC